MFADTIVDKLNGDCHRKLSLSSRGRFANIQRCVKYIHEGVSSSKQLEPNVIHKRIYDICLKKYNSKNYQTISTNYLQYLFKKLRANNNNTDVLFLLNTEQFDAEYENYSEWFDRCLCGFLVVEKDVCTDSTLSNAYAMQAIANVQTNTGVSRVGHLLVAAYLCSLKHIHQSIGLLELANGYTNLRGLWLFSHFGFYVDDKYMWTRTSRKTIKSRIHKPQPQKSTNGAIELTPVIMSIHMTTETTIESIVHSIKSSAQPTMPNNIAVLFRQDSPFKYRILFAEMLNYQHRNKDSRESDNYISDDPNKQSIENKITEDVNTFLGKLVNYNPSKNKGTTRDFVEKTLLNPKGSVQFFRTSFNVKKEPLTPEDQKLNTEINNNIAESKKLQRYLEELPRNPLKQKEMEEKSRQHIALLRKRDELLKQLHASETERFGGSTAASSSHSLVVDPMASKEMSSREPNISFMHSLTQRRRLRTHPRTHTSYTQKHSKRRHQQYNPHT